MISRILHTTVVVSVMRWTYRGMRRFGLTRFAADGQRLLRRAGGDVVEVRTPEGTLVQGSVDQIAEISDVAQGRYEAGTLALFRASLWPGARALDLGANIGVFTMVAARAVGPAGLVIAVEPDPRNLRYLEANIARQGFTNVEIVKAAVAAQAGIARFHSAMVATNSTLYPELLREDEATTTFDVATITVDDLLAGRSVDVIKMDIEGAEWATLDGMARTIDANPGSVLFIEYEEGTLRAAGATPAGLVERLRSHWAQVYVIDERRSVLVEPDEWNLLIWQNLICAPASFEPDLPIVSKAADTPAATPRHGRKTDVVT